MACIENIPPANADSEMEEGEIVDDLDDISSDEELLLRQRLHVLETYNNVLERKKASDISLSGEKNRCDLSRDLSEISASELEDNTSNLYRTVKSKHLKTHVKYKKRKEQISFKSSGKSKDYKKKVHRKKKLEIKIITESSEESDDEYRNKRRKLANAVSLNKDRSDTSTLSARLKKMLCGAQAEESKKNICTEDKQTETDLNLKLSEVTLLISDESLQDKPKHDCIEKNKASKDLPNKLLKVELKKSPRVYDLIDLCNDDDVKIAASNEQLVDTVDSIIGKDDDKTKQSDSDEDLELLRQHALQTKSSKLKAPQVGIPNEIENKPLILPEDEDSYTAELRLICLKSAYLKKAFEIKRKQKLKKRLSQSSISQDQHITELDMLPIKIDSQNNTDIESVDMEIGSDGDEKIKEAITDYNKNNNLLEVTEDINNKKDSTKKPKEDELEEDEDLLRAKLLTSLSKNLPNLIDSNILDSIEEVSNTNEPAEKGKKFGNTNVPETKKFIIQLGESDSEGEHEATKNLTKMHMKQQQSDFEQQLDLFLKCTRMEVERQLQPKAQEPLVQTPEKFVPKSVKHLPKSEQIEYRNLVKRMAELEKIKQSRQISMGAANPVIKSDKPIQVKETLKPRNISVETIDEQIAASRKKIAEESANINRLKEEATKLIRKHKIVTTELKNIATAIALNKKQQKSVHTRLSKIRAQHQMLLKSSSFTNSQTNGFLPPTFRPTNKMITVTKLQKENTPQKEEHRNSQILKSMTISVVNDFKENNSVDPRLSVQVDITNNKKIVKMPKSPIKQKSSDSVLNKLNNNDEKEDSNCDNTQIATADQPVVEKGGCKRKNSDEKNVNTMNVEEKRRKSDGDDYKSPLDALHTTNWEEDPNAVLCPFEVGGNCKDPDCKYLHPKLPSVQ